MKRWVRVGHGAQEDAREAASTAARAALEGPDPKLLLVYGPADGAPPREIADAIDEVAGGVPVIGCSATGHIGSGHRPDSGVLVIGIGGDIDVATAVGTDFNQRPRQVGEEVASALLPLPDRAHHLGLMLTDNLAGDQQELVRGVYSVFGATIPLVGAVAGNGVVPSPSWQIYDGKVLQDAVVAARLSSDGPFGISIKHAWRCDGDGMIVTGSAGNQVYTLDDGPALDTFLTRHEAPAGIEYDQVAFGAFALSRPLAVSRRGEVAVRHVVRCDPEDRSLYCAAAMPKGAAVWLATTDAEGTLMATDLACAEALDALGDAPPQGMLVFDCAGRRGVLQYEGVKAEWFRMRDHAGGAPVAGFYGNGEIARVHGANGFHNQTIVACALG